MGTWHINGIQTYKKAKHPYTLNNNNNKNLKKKVTRLLGVVTYVYDPNHSGS